MKQMLTTASAPHWCGGESRWGQNTGDSRIPTQPVELNSRKLLSTSLALYDASRTSFIPLFSFTVFCSNFVEEQESWRCLEETRWEFLHSQQQKSSAELWWEVGQQARRIASFPFSFRKEKSSEILGREGRRKLDKRLSRNEKTAVGLVFT